MTSCLTSTLWASVAPARCRQVWEEPGAVDPLATVTEILAAFGVDVRLASQDSRAERGACLFECLTAIEELQQRGNDLGGLKVGAF